MYPLLLAYLQAQIPCLPVSEEFQSVKSKSVLIDNSYKQFVHGLSYPNARWNGTKCEIEITAHRFKFFRPGAVLRARINQIEPSNGFILLFSTFTTGNFNQFFRSIRWEKTPSLVTHHESVPSTKKMKERRSINPILMKVFQDRHQHQGQGSIMFTWYPTGQYVFLFHFEPGP